MDKEELKSRLKKLPQRACVAFATRCARRVEPLYSMWSGAAKDHVLAFDSAIKVSESFSQSRCAAEEFTVDAFRAYRSAKATAAFYPFFDPLCAVALAAGGVHADAHAAAHAAHAVITSNSSNLSNVSEVIEAATALKAFRVAIHDAVKDLDALVKTVFEKK